MEDKKRQKEKEERQEREGGKERTIKKGKEW